MAGSAAASGAAQDRSLFAVVFLVRPNPERLDEYLGIAGDLRPRLAGEPGFIENGRFRSRSDPGTLLSISLWDDEKSLVRWRTAGPHHDAQVRGRAGVLAAYGIRVGEVAEAWGRHADGRALGWMRHDETGAGDARALVLLDGAAPPGSALAELAEQFSGRAGSGAFEADVFDHLQGGDRVALLTAWRTIGEARAFGRVAAPRVGKDGSVLVIRVIRTYGMDDRVEAPQFFG